MLFEPADEIEARLADVRTHRCRRCDRIVDEVRVAPLSNGYEITVAHHGYRTSRFIRRADAEDRARLEWFLPLEEIALSPLAETLLELFGALDELQRGSFMRGFAVTANGKRWLALQRDKETENK